jgi:RNA ligase (TIGR02306 family)
MEEVKRKLASIRVISEIKPIEGADNIELAIVDGWQCVVKKGDFEAGNLCVYFEIDSFLPIRPEFEFLRKSSYKKMGNKEGFRLKTIRLRGQISQGLVLRIGFLTYNAKRSTLYFSLEGDILRTIPAYPNLCSQAITLSDKEYEEFKRNSLGGTDLTEVLGIEKYEPPIPACLAGKVKGNFPSFIRKTDLERVQNIWGDIKDRMESFEVTVKLDGTSCTFYLKDGVFGVCSRNLELKEEENNTYWKMARKYNIEQLLRDCGQNLALQGEIIGEGIQGNPEGIQGQEFYLFDIWDIDNHRYLMPLERVLLWTDKFNSIPWCPYTEERGLSFDKDLSHLDLNEFLGYANGKSLHADMREGIVFKSNDSDLRFKVISNEYLLKKGD